MKLKNMAEATDDAEVREKLEFVTKRLAQVEVAATATAQQLLKYIVAGQMLTSPEDRPLGFNFEHAEQMKPEALSQEFKIGMAALAAGKDFHPKKVEP